MHLHWMLMKESPFILISSTERGPGVARSFWGHMGYYRRIIKHFSKRGMVQKKGITVGDRNRIKPLSMQMSVCCQPQSFGFRMEIRSSMLILMLNSMPLDVCWRRKGRLISPSTLQVDDFPLGNYTTTEPSLSWFDPHLRPKIEHQSCS